MRIVHVNEYASAARHLADAQRALGHDAIVLGGPHEAVVEPPDLLVPDSHNTAAYQLAILRKAETRDVDVFHVHGGIWRSHLLWPALKLLAGKCIVVQMHGSETRTGLGLHYLGVADHVFASTPDLIPRIPRPSTWLPDPVPIPPTRPDRHAGGRIVVGHFPSNREVKGTALLEDAFRGPGLREAAELRVVEGVPHAEALRIMSDCDLVVDQVNDFGIYSVVAIEAMARSKVVLSSFQPNWYPADVGAVRVTRDTLGDELRHWIAAGPEARARKGAEARRYAERVHAPLAVAALSIDWYRKLLGGPADDG